LENHPFHGCQRLYQRHQSKQFECSDINAKKDIRKSLARYEFDTIVDKVEAVNLAI
jgi:hypothetical protein